MEANFHTNEWNMPIFLHEELNLGCTFDTVGHGASSTSSRVNQYFDFIITKTQNASLHKTVV